MPKDPLRILIDTVAGGKYSYHTASFVDTSAILVLSSSQLYGRITWSLISCSYQNQPVFDGEILSINSASRL